VASFLADRFGERVTQLRFTQQVKSRLGWGFLAVVDTGRFQDHCLPVRKAKLTVCKRSLNINLPE